MKKNRVYALQKYEIGAATQFVQSCLEEFGIRPKEAIKGTLIAEEAIGSLISHAADSGELRISVRRSFGNVTVEMEAPGIEYPLAENMESASLTFDEELGREAQDAIRNIILRSFADDLKYRHKDGYNYIRMTLVESKRAFLYITLLSLFLSIVLGLLLTVAAPASFNAGLNKYLLSPVKTIYMNALKMIVAPVVFFSIVACIGGFSDLKELGKIGGRTFLLYAFTTVIAVMVGIGVFYLFRPGESSLAAAISAEGANAAVSGTADLSLLHLLIDMVPSNFVAPFLDSNMPQLIFLAVLCGVATGLIGQYSAVLRSLFEACNELFMKIASMIISLMPAAIFCSMMSMLITLGIGPLLSLAGMFATFVFGLFCMIAIYLLLVMCLGRLDPRPFIRKYFPVMLQVFSMSSSNAAIPVNMNACEKKLGISGRISSLSIPLGSTLNMDGTCIQLAVFALALAKVYGVPVSAGSLVTLAITIIILSMGAPGIPGAGVICLSVLLDQLNVPTDAVSLVMGIGPLLGMFLCMSNCTGDVVVTTIVAKKAGAIDMDVYRS